MRLGKDIKTITVGVSRDVLRDALRDMAIAAVDPEFLHSDKYELDLDGWENTEHMGYGDVTIKLKVRSTGGSDG